MFLISVHNEENYFYGKRKGVKFNVYIISVQSIYKKIKIQMTMYFFVFWGKLFTTEEVGPENTSIVFM